MSPRLAIITMAAGLTACAVRPASAQSRPDAAVSTRTAIVTVSQYLAVGWAETPTLTIDGAPAGTTAAMFIPASRGAGPSCWRGDAGTIRVGDRYRLTLSPLPAPASTGGPYSLHVRIHVHGVTTYWEIRRCESLQ